MSHFTKTRFFLLITLFIFSSCQKDQIIEEIIITDPEPIIMINGSVSGLVMDTNGAPLSGVTVSVDNTNVISDENGVFTFNNILLNEKGALVIAEKNGYYYNAQFVRPSLNTMAYAHFRLMEKSLTASFQSNDGGTIITNSNAKVDIAANSVQQEDGSVYTGTVYVYATWLDPTSEKLAFEMPGDLRGINFDQERVQLTTYGMIAVELEGENGQALNIVDGQTAIIELPIPDVLLSSAPSTIPLWHMNEETGMWEEEGEAILENGSYVGTVGHFSFWNCDVPGDFVTLSGRVENVEGGIGDLLVRITNDEDGVSAFGFTSEDGSFSGFVPESVPLSITITNACDEVVYTGPLGAFETDVTLDPFIIGEEFSNMKKISGLLQGCDFNGVTNGYVKVEYEGGYRIIYLDENGAFSNTVSICSGTTFTLTGYDLNTLKQSLPLTIDTTTTIIDVGSISVCDDLTEYYILTLEGETFVFPEFDVSIEDEEFYAFALESNPDVGFNTLQLSTLNIPPVNVVSPLALFAASNSNYNATCAGNSCTDLFIIFQSINFSNPGDIIQGEFGGEVLDGDDIAITVSGSFRAVKD